MTHHHLIVQRSATPSQLGLLFHGAGSSARDLAPLGEALAPHLPGATIVSLQASEAVGPGWQWFSVQGVTEADRPARVAAAISAFIRAVRQWQEACASREIERAIDFAEDEVMRLGRPVDVTATLWSTAPALRAWGAVSGPTMTIEIVEQWFGAAGFGLARPPWRVAGAAFGARGGCDAARAARVHASPGSHLHPRRRTT